MRKRGRHLKVFRPVIGANTSNGSRKRSARKPERNVSRNPSNGSPKAKPGTGSTCRRKNRAVGKIKVVALPYDCGRYRERMGSGPIDLLENGIVDSLRDQEHEVEVANVLLPEVFCSEGQALVQLQRRAVPIVREGLEKNQRILFLSGNCGPAALTAVSALGPRTTGVVWFDAHGDF